MSKVSIQKLIKYKQFFPDHLQVFELFRSIIEYNGELTFSSSLFSRTFKFYYIKIGEFIQVNGLKTVNENLADTGGIKVSYDAYRRYVEEDGDEPMLAGLNYTANQLFWISSARILCSVTRPEYKIIENLISDHLPHEYRIIGAFSNSESFSKDFGCRVGSTMNPTKKCEIW